MAKQKSLEQLRAEKEQVEKAACTGTAQTGAFGETERNIWRKAKGRNVPTAFAIWAARLRALPRRSKISHAPEMTELMEHIFGSAGGTESRPAHGDYTHQPSKQRKGAESQWHYSTSQ